MVIEMSKVQLKLDKFMDSIGVSRYKLSKDTGIRYDTINKYYKFFRINYPNISDASDGLRKGEITQEEFDEIKFEYSNGKCTDANTPLGGDMGIHGIGRLDYLFKYLPFVYNWTDGSIALSNEDIDELYSVVKKGTKVVIK